MARPPEVPTSPGHFRNWLDSIRSRKLPIADVEVGHNTNVICLLGNIAMWIGRKLAWDSKNERFFADRPADALLWRKPREPYLPRSV